jgi:hypothetical protein
MGLGVSIFLIAVGAVHTVGWILMGVGAAGALLSMIYWSSWAGPGYWSRRRTTYVEDGPPPY